MQVVPKPIKHKKLKKTQTKIKAKLSGTSLLQNSINSLVSNNTTNLNFNINININRQESSKSTHKLVKKATQMSQFKNTDENRLE
jgi:hypothetical protein